MANVKPEVGGKDAKNANVGKVDMKFEIVVVPVSDVDRAKSSTGGLGGGSTPTLPPVTTSA